MEKKLKSLFQIIKAEIMFKGDDEDLMALISHWLIFPQSTLPFLDDHKRRTISKEFLSENDNALSIRQQYLFDYYSKKEYIPHQSMEFKFIDLFAGIGGFRIAFQNAGGQCVFSSEWDRFARRTYLENFGEMPYGDITQIPKKDIPNHDVLCAGFPCQPFSIAGVSKKNSLGRKHGFEDKTQGTLFFEIKEILRIKRPKAFMLENVKNLVSHDKGRTFKVIMEELSQNLGYTVNWDIVDGANWVPQHRERIFIVGYDPNQIHVKKEEIIIPQTPQPGYVYPELKSIIKERVSGFTIGPGTWDTLQRHKKNHAQKGNGFGYRLHKLPIKNGEKTRTISARYHKDGAEILIEQKADRPRRLTIAEAMQLQGYDPSRFIFPVSKTQAYRQIGNSVVVPAVEACAKEIQKILKRS